MIFKVQNIKNLYQGYQCFVHLCLSSALLLYEFESPFDNLLYKNRKMHADEQMGYYGSSGKLALFVDSSIFFDEVQRLKCNHGVRQSN